MSLVALRRLHPRHEGNVARGDPLEETRWDGHVADGQKKLVFLGPQAVNSRTDPELGDAGFQAIAVLLLLSARLEDSPHPNNKMTA